MALHLLGLSASPEAVRECALRFGGRSWAVRGGERGEPPYRAIVEVSTDDPEAVGEVADVGLYVSYRRIIKPYHDAPSPGRVIASFGLVRRPDLSHRVCDDHWRDIHGPVALRCHLAMCDYEQLSIIATLHGAELDGMAMCAFPNRATLSDRFFNDDEARNEVLADVATFADTSRSLPRVVLNQTV